MKKLVYSIVSFLFPVVAFAQAINFNNLNTPISGLTTIINRIIPLIIGAAMLVFLWGVLRYVLAESDPAKRAEARSYMVWGIIALAVMVSVWGIVRLLQGTLGVSGGGSIDYPTIPGSR